MSKLTSVRFEPSSQTSINKFPTSTGKMRKVFQSGNFEILQESQGKLDQKIKKKLHSCPQRVVSVGRRGRGRVPLLSWSWLGGGVGELGSTPVLVLARGLGEMRGGYCFPGPGWDWRYPCPSLVGGKGYPCPGPGWAGRGGPETGVSPFPVNKLKTWFLPHPLDPGENYRHSFVED